MTPRGAPDILRAWRSASIRRAKLRTARDGTAPGLPRIRGAISAALYLLVLSPERESVRSGRALARNRCKARQTKAPSYFPGLGVLNVIPSRQSTSSSPSLIGVRTPFGSFWPFRKVPFMVPISSAM